MVFRLPLHVPPLQNEAQLVHIFHSSQTDGGHDRLVGFINTTLLLLKRGLKSAKCDIEQHLFDLLPQRWLLK